MAGEEKVEEAKVEPAVDTQEQSKKEAQDFLMKYGELVKEQGWDFASYPVWVPDGNGGFRTVIQSTPVNIKNAPQKSPFMASE